MILDDDDLKEAKEAFQRWAEHNPHWTDPLTCFLAGFQVGAEPKDHPGTDREPSDLATRLCNIAAKAIRKHPEARDEDNVKLIVSVFTSKGAGTEVSGYHDSADAVADLWASLKELLKAHGIDMNEAIRVGKLTTPEAFVRRRTNVPAGFRRGLGNL